MDLVQACPPCTSSIWVNQVIMLDDSSHLSCQWRSFNSIAACGPQHAQGRLRIMYQMVIKHRTLHGSEDYL